MNQETKICQNCKNQFTIELEDFVFYEKIQVLSPTFCPECRMQRRLSWRNERNLYKRKCDLCGEDVVSTYHYENPHTVYCQQCWWSDGWDFLQYGEIYNFQESFFQQFQDLKLKVPRVAAINKGDIDSSYSNISLNNKNCYFLIESANNEDCYYGYWLENYCKDVFDSAYLTKVEIAYDSLFAWDSFRLFFSKDCHNCISSRFLLNCSNCSNCFGCVNLRNKSYCIFNKPYLKEEYYKKVESFNLGSFKGTNNFKNKFMRFLLKFPRRFSHILKSPNSSGDYIVNSNNCKESFYIDDAENIFRGVHVFFNAKDNMDIDTVGLNAELCYETINTGVGANNMKFCMRCWTGSNSCYCDNCDDSNFNFACVGLRHKQYCILNKQYTKEQYEELVPKIIKHMNDMPYTDKKGRIYRYGEFFPMELSPFAYNETIAQEYFPLTKEQAIEQGYQWKESETKDYKITMRTEQIPDHIKDVKDDIVDQIIQCIHYDIDTKQTICNEQCSTAFRIIPRELEFYRKNNIPIPRLCPNCRHYQRIKQRNPLKLWHRQCQCAGTQSDNKVYQNTISHNHHGTNHCPNEFETTYAPERPEIVYCERCYQEEVA